MGYKFNPFTGTFDNDTISTGGGGAWGGITGTLSDQTDLQIALNGKQDTSASTIYVTTTGNDSNSGLSWSAAKLTIPAAIAALPASGGLVKVGPGTFSVSSVVRSDTVSYASGSTFNDASAINGDVGKYVLWGNMGRVAKITSVVAGVSFTVDVLPTTHAATTAKIVTPAIVVPEGVTLEGTGSNFNQQLTAGSSTSQTCTQISDSGSGVTILIRGANSVSGNATRYEVSKMSVIGNSGNMFGLFVGNGAWYVESNDLELSSHGIAGLALDGNINSHDFRNTIMYGNGSASAATPTGGIVTHPYNVGGSASCNFYNAFFSSNYGFGICDGDVLGSYGVVLWSPQFNSIQTSAMTNSGSSMVLQSNTYGRAVVVGGWSESAAAYDAITAGDVTITGVRMHSTHNYHWLVKTGTAYAENCSFDGAALFSVSITGGATFTWNAVDCTDPGLYSGGPSTIPSMGSSATIFANTLNANGITNIGDFTVKDAASATKAMRFQTSGASLDVAFGGSQTYISNWTGAGFTGTQNFYMAFDTSGNFDAFGVWRFHTAPFGSTTVTIDSGSATPLAVTGNISATGTVTGSNLSGTNTGDQTLPVGGTPALTLGTANTAGSSPNFLRRDDTILAFDATAPSTQAYGDSAAVGVATVAARRDHKHAMPASTKDTTAQTGILKGNGSTISAVTAPTGTIVGTSDSQTLTNKVLTSPTITTGITPTTDDGAALGSSSLKFSDIFLASGAVINFNAGDVTLTHTVDALTLSSGAFINYNTVTDSVQQVLTDTTTDLKSRFDLLGNGTNGRGKLTISGAHSGFDGTQNGDGAAILTMIHDNQAAHPKRFTFTTVGSPAQMKLDIEDDGAGTGHIGIMKWFSDGGVQMGYSGGKIGFLDKTPITKPTVSGSRGANAALASLLTQLANLGLITDSSS